MTNNHESPAVIGTEWDLPDSETCSLALQLVDDVSPAFLTNHCIRSYLFARELAAAKGMRSDADYVDEVVFLACILHDLGITDYGSGDQRFEVEGADAAARFLRGSGVAEDRIATVWQSIALHTSVGLAERFGTVHSIVMGGISLDVNGIEKDRLSPGFAERAHSAFPRQKLGISLADAIAKGTRVNPTKAPPFSFPAHVDQIVNGTPSISFLDIVGWGDGDVKAVGKP